MTEAMDKGTKPDEKNETIKAFGAVGGALGIGLFTTATIMLGTYAYKNPDPLNCWVVRDLHSGWTSKADAITRADAMDIDVTSGFPMEMHEVFLVWFLWGFWAKVALFAAAALSLSVYQCSPDVGKIVGIISITIYSLNSIVWLGVGAVWRYSKGG